MIPLRRTGEPRVLRENGIKWRDELLAERAREPGRRPRSARYAHEEVKTALGAMSRGKCCYCEAKPDELEVDHYVEVAEDAGRSFVWENLYLACKLCQRKATNEEIPVSDCLDPCDEKVAPGEHLDFTDEQIRARDESALGDRTIRKYRLESGLHDHRRMKQLNLFLRELVAIQAKALEEGRKVSEREWTELRRYRGRGHPYSLMFDRCLEKLGQ